MIICKAWLLRRFKKHQAPITKHQRNIKSQTPNRRASIPSSLHRAQYFWGLAFGGSLEIGAWSLELLAKARES